MAAEQQSTSLPSAASWQPGLIALHGNQTETLADTVLAWIAAHPLNALEPEIVLVQSNGMAEWFKMRMADTMGVCAAAQVELPARFVWRSYRQILGKHEVPRESPLDDVGRGRMVDFYHCSRGGTSHAGPWLAPPRR